MPDFRKMRRFKQQLEREDCLEVIRRGTSGVLSVLGDNGYPYGVPLSYIFFPGEPDMFYFHSANEGHKIDAIKDYEKASFTIIDRDDVVADEFTTYFKSVISFGKVHIIDEPDEMRRLVTLLAKRYSPDESDESVEHEVNREFSGLAMIGFEVEHMTGKEAIELMRNRRKYE